MENTFAVMLYFVVMPLHIAVWLDHLKCPRQTEEGVNGIWSQ